MQALRKQLTQIIKKGRQRLYFLNLPFWGEVAEFLLIASVGSGLLYIFYLAVIKEYSTQPTVEHLLKVLGAGILLTWPILTSFLASTQDRESSRQKRLLFIGFIVSSVYWLVGLLAGMALGSHPSLTGLTLAFFGLFILVFADTYKVWITKWIR